ncbi:MAG: hypothetical protein WCT04_12675 [Planctomycetota bacterium]
MFKTSITAAAMMLALAFVTTTSTRADDTCGRYENRQQTVLVCAAHTERTWVEPTYRTIYHCGEYQRVQVSVGYWQTYTVPARYETRWVRVWVNGRSY